MITYQIQTKNGFILGFYGTIGPRHALNCLAKEKGYESFDHWCKCLGLRADYEVSDFRIII